MQPRFRAFIDESYGKDDYYVGAVLMSDAQYATLVQRLTAIRLRVHHDFGVPTDIEFHAHRLMQAQAPWTCMQGQLHEAVAIYRAVLRTVVDAGAVVMLEGVDVPRLRARYRYPDPPYEAALRHLLEHIDRWVASRGATCGVVADLIDRHNDFAEAIAGYTRVGTPGFRPSRLERIEGPVWVDSESELGVQAADMVTYILRRHREVVGAPKAMRATRSLRHQIAPAVKHERKWMP